MTKVLYIRISGWLTLTLITILLLSLTGNSFEGLSEDEARDLKYSYREHEIQIDSAEKNQKNVYTMKVTADNNLRIRFLLIDNLSKKQVNVSIEFDKLFLFKDKNGNGIFDNGDYKERESLIEAFRPFQFTNLTDGTYRINVITETGYFELEIYITTTEIEIGTVPITPLQMKLDWKIVNFDKNGYSAEYPHYIGLKLKFMNDFITPNTIFDKENKSINHIVNNTGLYFNWSSPATIDGVSKIVTSNNLTRENDKETLTIYYPAGNRIIHDPTVDIKFMEEFVPPVKIIEPMLKGDIAIYISTVVVTVLVVGIINRLVYLYRIGRQ